MSTLKTNEWQMISDVLLELYALEKDELTVKKEMLSLLQALIPFNVGSFVLIDKQDKKIDRTKSVWLHLGGPVLERYLEYDYQNDYIFNMLNYTKSVVYRDTDLLDDHAREKTKYYTEFLQPNDIPYIAGIIFVHEGRLLGLLNLFRSEEFGDFTEKELFVLEQFKNHFTNILVKAERHETAVPNFAALKYQIINTYGLTFREMDIVELIISGYSNHEIGELLTISESTVKKHVYNIFKKMGVGSRTLLLKKINRSTTEEK